MVKKISLFICLTLLTATFTFALNKNLIPHFKNVTLVLDAVNKPGLPGNFRTTNDPIRIAPEQMPDLHGLSWLKASGSAQFSERGLQSIKQAISYRFQITVVDLRQESHGFINGIAVSWHGPKNAANVGLTTEEILRDEQRRLNRLAQSKTVIIKQKSNKSFKQPIKILPPIKTQSEAELVQSMGLNYIRVPATDHHRPADQEVDRFIDFVNTLPNNAWLHFHCRAGIGRTTIFLQMYDMMRNAKEVRFIDIVRRQVLLGGESVIKDYACQNPQSKNTIEKTRFLQQFYLYCQTNQDNFSTSWTEWLEQKNKG